MVPSLLPSPCLGAALPWAGGRARPSGSLSRGSRCPHRRPEHRDPAAQGARHPLAAGGHSGAAGKCWRGCVPPPAGHLLRLLLELPPGTAPSHWCWSGRELRRLTPERPERVGKCCPSASSPGTRGTASNGQPLRAGPAPRAGPSRSCRALGEQLRCGSRGSGKALSSGAKSQPRACRRGAGVVSGTSQGALCPPPVGTFTGGVCSPGDANKLVSTSTPQHRG